MALHETKSRREEREGRREEGGCRRTEDEKSERVRGSQGKGEMHEVIGVWEELGLIFKRVLGPQGTGPRGTWP